MPSSFDPSVVSSSRCFGSDGAASEELTRSRYSIRCVCGSVRTSLKPAASWIAFDRYPSASSSAFAEARSVSSVMYVFLIHEAGRVGLRRRGRPGWRRGRGRAGGEQQGGQGEFHGRAEYATLLPRTT